jgi:hypothetical protein
VLTTRRSVEDVEPAKLVGNRKKNQNGPRGMIRKGQRESLLGNGAGDRAKKVLDNDGKKPSLKIKIKLNLNVKLTLDAHVDGVIEIGLL